MYPSYKIEDSIWEYLAKDDKTWYTCRNRLVQIASDKTYKDSFSQELWQDQYNYLYSIEKRNENA